MIITFPRSERRKNFTQNSMPKKSKKETVFFLTVTLQGPRKTKLLVEQWAAEVFSFFFFAVYSILTNMFRSWNFPLCLMVLTLALGELFISNLISFFLG